MIPSGPEIIGYLGTPLRILFVYNQDGDPFDVTGYTATLNVYKMNPRALVESVEMTNPEDNRIWHEFTKQDVADLPSNGRYEIIFTDKSDTSVSFPVHRERLAISNVYKSGPTTSAAQISVVDTIENVVGVKPADIPISGLQGPKGSPGIVISDDEPDDTDIVWADTSEGGKDVVTPLWTPLRSLSDLAPFLIGNEYVLPAGLFVPSGTIDLGDRAIRLSTGTTLRGLADAQIISSATGGVVRATNVDSAVILREFSVIATAGECLNVQGSTDHQFNAFFVGMFGVKAAIVNGFDVQSFKDCFTEAADGITCGGETNKIFIAHSPFYGITSGNAAIELASNLDAKRIDIANPWFKGIDGVGLRAQSGYQLEYGRFSDGMFEDVAQELDGVEVEDLNWWFSENDGLENSRCIAGSRLASPTTTVITTQNTWTPVQGTFTLSENSERFEINGDNELVYVGRDPIRVLATIAVASSPPASTTWQFAILKDGTINADSVITVVQGSGVAAQPRTVTVVATLRLTTGDNFKLACRNNTNTSDLPKSNVSYAVSD